MIGWQGPAPKKVPSNPQSRRKPPKIKYLDDTEQAALLPVLKQRMKELRTIIDTVDPSSTYGPVRWCDQDVKVRTLLTLLEKANDVRINIHSNQQYRRHNKAILCNIKPLPSPLLIITRKRYGLRWTTRKHLFKLQNKVQNSLYTPEEREKLQYHLAEIEKVFASQSYNDNTRKLLECIPFKQW